MSDELIQTAVAAWARRNLPARLGAAETAKLLGSAEHDIQILIRVGKLKPLGNPAPNAPKWFAAVELIRLAMDVNWLNNASREVAKYWKHKRLRQRNAAAARDESTGESTGWRWRSRELIESASRGWASCGWLCIFVRDRERRAGEKVAGQADEAKPGDRQWKMSR